MEMALPEVEIDWSAVQTEECEETSLCGDNLTYSVFSEMIESPVLGVYCGFGICVNNEQGCCLCTVHDITCEREQLEGLVTLCNRLNLSFCHLYDVIEDFLS